MELLRRYEDLEDEEEKTKLRSVILIEIPKLRAEEYKQSGKIDFSISLDEYRVKKQVS